MNTPTSTPQVSVTPPSKTPHRRHYLVSALIGSAIVSLLILAANAMGAWPFSKFDMVALSPSPTTDSTASWKTYTQPKYGFIVQHPAQFKTDEIIQDDQMTVWLGTDKELSDLKNLDGAGYRYFLSITAIKTSGKQPLSCEPWTAKAVIRIGGAEAVRCTGWADDPEHVGFEFYSIAAPDTLFLIETYQYSGLSKDLVERILSTLQFMN